MMAKKEGKKERRSWTFVSVETSQGREQLRQTVHLGEDGSDSHGQVVHDESGSDGVYGFLVSQSGIRATRLNRWNILSLMASFNLIRFSPLSISPSPKTFSFIFTTQGLSPSLSLFLYLSICLSLSLFSLLPSSFRTPDIDPLSPFLRNLATWLGYPVVAKGDFFQKKKRRKKLFTL